MRKRFIFLSIMALLLTFQSEASALVKKNGPEFQVYAGYNGDTDWPSISMAADGSFIVAWRTSTGTLAQRYDSNGNTSGAQILVSNNGGIPSVAMAQDGSFIITYWGSDVSGAGVFAQRYDTGGLPIGSPFQVNTYVTGDQSWPHVAISQTGSFIITWQSMGQDGSGYGIFAQRYDINGNQVGGEFQVNTTTIYDQTRPHIANSSSDGSFVITWDGNMSYSSGSRVFAQRYNSSGVPLGTEFQVNTFSSEEGQNNVAMASGGSFVVTWMSWPQDGSGEGVYAQRYDVVGNPVGSEFRVNTYTTDRQEMPAVSMSPDGSFVITWGSAGQEGFENEYGIFAKRYRANGIADGPEFQVNTYTNENQTWPAVAAKNGSFVITWMSYWVNTGIFGQRFTYK